MNNSATTGGNLWQPGPRLVEFIGASALRLVAPYLVAPYLGLGSSVTFFALCFE